MRKRTKKFLIVIPVATLLVVFSFYYFFPGTTFNTLVVIERRAAGLEQKNIRVGQLSIEFLEGGQGEPLVLLHGFGANKDNWTRMAKYLTPHFRVIAPDLPGFGQSSRDMGATYTYNVQVDRLHQFIKAMALDRFHLGGNSMGGHIAGKYTEKFEKEVSSLWLIAPGGIISPQPSELSQRLESGGRNPLIANSTEEYDELLDFVFVKRPPIPGAIKRHLTQEAIDHRPLNQIIFEQIKSAHANNQASLEATLKKVQTKTLIVWGDKDRVLHVSGAQVLESAMSNAKRVIMDNIGHAPMIESPEACANIYLKFLGKKSS